MTLLPQEPRRRYLDIALDVLVVAAGVAIALPFFLVLALPFFGGL